MGWFENLKKILSGTWGLVGVAAIIVFIVFAITDIDEKLFAPENLPNLVVILLLLAVAFLVMRPTSLLRPDPMEVLAKATHTHAFLIKGYHFENIEKKSVFWESGNNCYYFSFHIPSVNLKVWALVNYFPSVVVLDLIEKDFAPAEKKKKLGLEWSMEEIKKLLDTQKKAEELVEGV